MRRMVKFNFYLLIVVSVFFFNLNARASQDINFDKNPELEQYINNIKYIFIDIDWKNRDNYYQYLPNYMHVRKLQDYNFRYSHDLFLKLMWPNGYNDENNIAQKLRERLKKNLKSNAFNSAPILIKGNAKENAQYLPIEHNRALLVRFHVGQQKINILNRDALIGAISVDLSMYDNEEDSFILAPEFYPEPFMIHVDKPEFDSLNRSVDFITLQVGEYLNYLDFLY